MRRYVGDSQSWVRTGKACRTPTGGKIDSIFDVGYCCAPYRKIWVSGTLAYHICDLVVPRLVPNGFFAHLYLVIHEPACS